METKKSTENPGMIYADKFHEHLNTIPIGEFRKTLINLSKYLDVTKDILYNYRTGRTYIRKSERVRIEEFFNQKIF
jgi:hypothetical protein